MKVKLFANLADIAGQRVVTVDRDDPATVDEVLDAVFAAHPGLEDAVLTEDGDLQEHINVLVDGSNVRHEPEGFSMEIGADDEVAIFPPVSGG